VWPSLYSVPRRYCRRYAGEAPVYKAPAAFSWTGCYIVPMLAAAGASRVRKRPVLPTETAGFFGGGQVGCDYQASNWVLGVGWQFQRFAHARPKNRALPSYPILSSILLKPRSIGSPASQGALATPGTAGWFTKGGGGLDSGQVQRPWYRLHSYVQRGKHANAGGLDRGCASNMRSRGNWSFLVEYDY